MSEEFPWATLIRAAIKFGSGLFFHRGTIDESWLEIITAMLAFGLATAWGYAEKQRIQRKLRSIKSS